jgi:hypothetical protein
MQPTLYDDMWTRRGVCLLWDADALAKICKPHQVASLRHLLTLQATGWPEDQLGLIDETTLVIAGLEVAIDALPPEESIVWLEKVVYQAIVSFQREVAYGGNEASLVFWISDSRRIEYKTSDDTFYWHCATEYKGHQIPLSRCLFNGGQGDARRIHTIDASKNEHWVGLFHPKVSS